MDTRHVPVNFDELEAAFEFASDGATYYLDLETGAVVLITDEVRDELYAIEEACDDAPGADDDRFASELERRNLPDWMRVMVREAYEVEQGYGSRASRMRCWRTRPSASAGSPSSLRVPASRY